MSGAGLGTVMVSATVPLSVRSLLAPQIARLAENGYRVEVATSPGDDHLFELSGVAQVHVLPMSRDINLIADLRAFAAWLRLLRRVRPRAIVAFSPKASLLSLLAARLVGVPERLYSTGGLRLETATGPTRVVLLVAEWLTCSAATRVIANSPSLARVYRSLHLARGKTVWTLSRKGVDHRHFDPATAPTPAAITGPSELPVVGFVGRITRDKGITVLAEALSILRDDGITVRTLVVGPREGPDSDVLVDRLQGATPYLTLPGAVSDPRAYYAAMDVLVLPSAREGFPNVVIEAAAMGVPAVVSDATGCVDSVDSATGLTFRTGDAMALADALARLLNRPAERKAMGVAARARAVLHFDPHEVIGEQLHLMGLEVQPCAASRDT